MHLHSLSISRLFTYILFNRKTRVSRFFVRNLPICLQRRSTVYVFCFFWVNIEICFNALPQISNCGFVTSSLACVLAFVELIFWTVTTPLHGTFIRGFVPDVRRPCIAVWGPRQYISHAINIIDHKMQEHCYVRSVWNTDDRYDNPKSSGQYLHRHVRWTAHCLY